MDSRFRRNALLANTALILHCYIWGVRIVLRSRRKLLRRQTYCHRIPELVLSLSLPLSESHKRTATKN